MIQSIRQNFQLAFPPPRASARILRCEPQIRSASRGSAAPAAPVMGWSRRVCQRTASRGRRHRHVGPSKCRSRRHCAAARSLFRNLRCAQRLPDQIGCAPPERADRCVDYGCAGKRSQCAARARNAGTVACKTPRNQYGSRTARTVAFAGNNVRRIQSFPGAPAREFFPSACE